MRNGCSGLQWTHNAAIWDSPYILTCFGFSQRQTPACDLQEAVYCWPRTGLVCLTDQGVWRYDGAAEGLRQAENMGLNCHGRGKRCHLSNKSSVLSSVLKHKVFFNSNFFNYLRSRGGAVPQGKTNRGNLSNPNPTGSQQDGSDHWYWALSTVSDKASVWIRSLCNPLAVGDRTEYRCILAKNWRHRPEVRVSPG